MVDFKGVHFPKEAILYAVFFYLRYPGSYRELEEILEERGVDVDHGTLNRWVVKFAPLLAAEAQSRKKPTALPHFGSLLCSQHSYVRAMPALKLQQNLRQNPEACTRSPVQFTRFENF